jgi:tricorn protease-like protein
LKVSPTEDKVALTNHRQELLVVDLQDGSVTTRGPQRVAPDRRGGLVT